MSKVFSRASRTVVAIGLLTAGLTVTSAEGAGATTPPPIRVADVSYPDQQSRVTVLINAWEILRFYALDAAPVRMQVQPGGVSAPGAMLTCVTSCVTDRWGYARATLRNDSVGGTDEVLVHLDLDDDGAIDAAEPTTSASVQWKVRPTRVLPVVHPLNQDFSALGLTAHLQWEWGLDCSGGGGYSGGGCTPIVVPVAGRTLQFFARGSDTELCSAVTDARGMARCGGPVAHAMSLAAGGFRASFVTDGLYGSSSTTYTAMIRVS